MTSEKTQVVIDEYALYLGDCVDLIDVLPDESVGLSVFSPPFPGMYAYTDSPRDMGNVRDIDEMLAQFRFYVEKSLRVHQPGRMVCCHLTQVPTFKYLEGYVGLKDFRGKTISLYEDCGWIYYGEVLIDKDPQVKAVRTKDASLAFKSLATDSARMRPCLADYLLLFKKHGDNVTPIKAGASDRYGNDNGWITNDEWINWAQPVWYRQRPELPGGIRETDVLTARPAKDAADEKHLCPLQLGVIERAVKLWSAPGETVLSPFMGIGSEGHQAVRFGRKFVGFELKPSYFEQAVQYIEQGAFERRQDGADLLSFAADQARGWA